MISVARAVKAFDQLLLVAIVELW